MDKLLFGLQVTFLGMLIVFIGLMLIMYLLKLMDFGFKRYGKVEERPESASTDAGVPGVTARAEYAVEAGEDEALLSVLIAAAVASMEEETGVGLRVRSIRRVGQGAWGRAGRGDLIS